MNEYVSILIKDYKLSNLVICAERKTQIPEIRDSQNVGKKKKNMKRACSFIMGNKENL